MKYGSRNSHSIYVIQEITMTDKYQVHRLCAARHQDVEPMLNYMVQEAANTNTEIVSHTIYVNPEDNCLYISVITKAKEPQHV